MIVLIPTCKSVKEMKPLVEEITKTIPQDVRVYASCRDESAAYNRNDCLFWAHQDEIVIFVDDDMEGFFLGWIELLVKPLEDNSIIMVAARLLRPNGKLAFMMGENYDLTEPIVEVKEKRIPTACIAFKHKGITFDESFKGSGFEDTDFMKQYEKEFPNGKFVVNNNVRLIHRNEMKNQKGEYWKKNQAYFVKKYPEEYEKEMGHK